MKRSSLWIILWFIGGFIGYQILITESEARYAAGDLSAFAWHGFWPYVISILLGYSAFVVVPLMCVVEFVIWLRKK